MKKFFRVALVCALAGATLLYTGCTKDYSEDISSLTKQVDDNGVKIKTLEGQVDDLLKAKQSLEEADRLAKEAIDDLKPRVATLEEKVDSLEKEKARLENLINQNIGNIGDLQRRMGQVEDAIKNLNEVQIPALKGQITDLDSTIRAHKTIIDSLGVELAKKADKTYVDQELAKKADQTYVDTELGKKADKVWVEETLKNYATVKALTDTAAALRAKLNLMDQEIADIKEDISDLNSGLGKLGTRLSQVADSVAVNDAAIKAINSTIDVMQPIVNELQAWMTEAKVQIKKAQDTADQAVADAASALSYAKGVENFVKNNYYMKKQVDQLLEDLKKDFNQALKDSLAKKVDLEVWKKDTARINAKFKSIDGTIEQVIKDYKAGDDTLQAHIDALEEKVMDLLGTKLDTTTFNDYVAKIREELDGVQKNIGKLLARVQSIVYVPEYDDNRITLAWAQMYPQSMFDTRDLDEELPASYSEDWKAFFESLFGPIPADLEDELSNVMNEVILPGNGPLIPVIDYPYAPIFGGLFPTPDQYNGPKETAATPIVEPTHVKYRVYGEDAASIVEALVKSVKEGSDLLAFDVVRVRTRVNKDDVELNIVDAEVDDLFSEKGDASVIDLTVVPTNLPADFWLYTWDVKNLMNPKLHQYYFFFQYLFAEGRMSQELYTWLYNQYVNCGGILPIYDNLPRVDGTAVETEPAAEVEEDTEFPAFSVSLVLTDKEESRLITSAYNNVVPAAQSDAINLWIRRNEEDVTYRSDDHIKGFLDTVEIPYVDLAKYELLGNTELMFNFKGEDYTADEFDKLGFNLGDPQARFFAYKDYSGSIAVKKGEELPEDYIQNTADDDAPVAYANLKEVTPLGVGAEEVVALTYFVGPASVWTAGYVKVTPVKVAEVVDIWETKDLTPFTWNYTKDAAVDAALFRGETPSEFYRRDSAVAVYDEAKVKEDFEKAGIEIADFAGLVPDPDTTFIIAFYEDGASDTVKLADLLLAYEDNEPAFRIYPFFDADDNNALKANVTNFLFNDLNPDEAENHGAVTKITYSAIYNLPDDEQPAVEVTITGKIVFDDRDRSDIIVNLPETFEPWVVDYAKEILDTLYNAEPELVPSFPAGTYAAHSLTDADLIDAYGKGYNSVDSLTMTVDGEVITKSAKKRIVTTVDEQHEDAGHVLDYNTSSNFQVSWAAGKEIEPYQTFKSVDTLWYGQVVVVNKTVRLDVDGIFEFERIPEYVAETDADNYYTTLQPWWHPDLATLKPYDVPVNGYEAHQVLLNQHFRVVDVLKTVANVEAGQPVKDAKVIATEIVSVEGSETTDPETGEVTSVEPVTGGDLRPEYKPILSRIFKLEEPGHVGDTVSFIADPRAAEQPELIAKLEEMINPVKMGVTIDADNVVSYYSESTEEDAIGLLYGVNSDGSKVKMVTNFDRASVAEPSAKAAERLEKAGVAVENYENYVIKLFDPLRDIVAPEDVQQINVNNSIITHTSIYQFITLKDKRDYDLIGVSEVGEDQTGAPYTLYGWITGNVDPTTKKAVVEDEEPNGFEDGVKTNEVYSLVFTNELEYVTEVSPETKARINFNEETGELTYNNTLQTQLAVPIDMILKVNVEYPWGTKAAAVKVQFYNKPVGD